MYKLWLVSVSLFWSLNAHANDDVFSAEKYIKTCLQAQLSDSERLRCSGFFYGLLSKQQNLLSSDDSDGVIERAKSTRKAVNNYASVKGRNLGLSAICVPAGLDLDEFRRVIKESMDNSKIYDYSVEGISTTLAYSFQCSSE
ncbi:hypothetical protein [Thalassotalea aquiviva]|uniref:hypothetical protein n=1 Tax=Thalassotalea aquiviva TaxID=3242415 RepID=UPI00352A8A49